MEDLAKTKTRAAQSVDRLMARLARLKSVRVQDELRLRQQARFESIVIVGSTCAGKTTVVDAIRKSHLTWRDLIVVPLRYITRPKRGQDNTVENSHLTADEFTKKVDSGTIGLHWVRKMEGDRTEQYGFASAPAGKIPVYSGNNALYSNSCSVRPLDALNSALFVGVYAPDEVRRQRLVARSPDMLYDRPEEVDYRLGDHSGNMLPYVHLVVENHGLLESVVEEDVVLLTEAIVQYE